jgi:nucleoside-diphosphate-sugar epimerase
MRTAILGGTGSIGMATAMQLAEQGVEVTLLSRRPPAALPKGVEWRPVDVSDQASVRKALSDPKPDRVVHLAALLQFASQEDPPEAARVNVDGTRHVLEACRSLRIRRVVFGSSIAVYGERSDLMRETDELPPEASLYGVTKQLAERLGERFRLDHGIQFVALRYSGIFAGGKAMSAGMARVRERILECARGGDVQIDGASGEERAHLTHVRDAAAATCAALLAEKSPPHSAYNVAGPAENYVSLRQLHALVCELVPGAGRALWSSQLARSAGPVDTSRISQDLGWRPTVALREGLQEMLTQTRSTRSRLEEIR